MRKTTALVLASLAILTTLGSSSSGREFYHFMKLPPEVRAEFRKAQVASEVSAEDKWIELNSDTRWTSFLDITSLYRVLKRPSYVRAKFLYVFRQPVEIDEKKAKIAYRDGIFNCVNYRKVTVSTTYFGGAGDNFKQIIPGSPEEVEFPAESSERDEIMKVCELNDAINPRTPKEKIIS